MTRIFITGDIHGEIDIHKLSKRNFPEGQNLTKDDYLIICGDFGLVWGGQLEKSNHYWQEWLSKQPWTTLFIDGNHENFDLLSQYPVEQWNGGKIHKITDSIYHLMRGEIFEIGDYSFFAFGGAFSHDRQYRKEGISWWQDELPTHDEVENALHHLEKHHQQVDYIITHDAPSDIQYYLGFQSHDMYAYDQKYENITSFLQYIKNTVSYKQWFMGHYHIDKTIMNHQVLYYDIIEIENID